MIAKNVNVPGRVIESRPKTKSCARCTVNSMIDSNEEIVSGTFCFIGAPVGACARPLFGKGTGPMWDSLARDSLRAGLVFGKRQRANAQPGRRAPECSEARDAARSQRRLLNAPSGSRNRCSGHSGTLRFSSAKQAALSPFFNARFISLHSFT